MNIYPQVIKQNGKAAFVVLPIHDYEQMLRRLEEQEDIQAIDDYLEHSPETFPMAVAEKIANGENPIKVFRLYRGISQVALAKMVRVSKQYISQLEKGERGGAARTLKKIAKALQVSIEDIS